MVPLENRWLHSMVHEMDSVSAPVMEKVFKTLFDADNNQDCLSAHRAFGVNYYMLKTRMEQYRDI